MACMLLIFACSRQTCRQMRDGIVCSLGFFIELSILVNLKYFIEHVYTHSFFLFPLVLRHVSLRYPGGTAWRWTCIASLLTLPVHLLESSHGQSTAQAAAQKHKSADYRLARQGETRIRVCGHDETTIRGVDRRQAHNTTQTERKSEWDRGSCGENRTGAHLQLLRVIEALSLTARTSRTPQHPRMSRVCTIRDMNHVACTGPGSRIGRTSHSCVFHSVVTTQCSIDAIFALFFFLDSDGY